MTELGSTIPKDVIGGEDANRIEGEAKQDLKNLIESVNVVTKKSPENLKNLSEEEKKAYGEQRRKENGAAYAKISEIQGINQQEMYKFLNGKIKDKNGEERDMNFQEKARQKSILRNAIVEVESGKVDENNFKILTEAGISEEFLKTQGIELKDDGSKMVTSSKEVKLEFDKNLVRTAEVALNAPEGPVRDEAIKTLMKSLGKLPPEMVEKLLSAAPVREKKETISEAIARIEGMNIPPETKKRQLNDLLRRHPDATEEEINRISGLTKSIGEKESIIEVSDKELADIREQMIEKFKNYSATSTEQIKKDFDAFLNQQKYRLSKLAGKFSDQVEKDLKMEFVARGELSSVMRFWDKARTLNPEKKALNEISSSSIDDCIRISRETYIWLASQDKMLYRKKGINGELLEGTTEVNSFSMSIDMALKDIYEQIHKQSGGLNMWGVSTGAALDEKLKEIVGRNPSLSLDAARLAWQVASVECWGADRNDGWVSHPVFKLVHPAEWRDFLARNGSSIPGGSRLWVEYRQNHKGAMPDKATGVRLFSEETPQMARVGYDTWPNRGGRDAVNDGRYLREFVDKMRDPITGGRLVAEGGEEKPGKEFNDVNLPQTAVMLDLTKANACWSAMEELGKIEAGKVSVDVLVKLRGAMTDVLSRQGLASLGPGDKMIEAKDKAGRLLNSFVKDLVWQVSWSNPANDLEGKAVPMAVMNKLLFEVLCTYISKDESMNSSVDRFKRSGYGGFLGFGATREESVAEVKKFVKWYNNKIIPESKSALVFNNKKGIDGKTYTTTLKVTKKRSDEDMKGELLTEFSESKLFPIFTLSVGDKWWLK